MIKRVRLPLHLFALLLAGAACAAQEPSSPPAAAATVAQAAYPSRGALADRIASIVRAPGVSRAHWGVAVTTMDGTPIFGLNEGQYFRPASNAKLFTTAAAMHLLGPESKVQTALVSERADAAGIVHGNLRLIGNGDANLSGRHLPYRSPAQIAAACPASCPPADPFGPLREMVRDLKQQESVTSIGGDIVAGGAMWPSEPYGVDWTLDDIVWGYSAPVSEITVNDNQIELTVLPGAKAGDAATVTLLPSLPYYTLDVQVTTVAADAHAQVDMTRAPGTKTLRIFGTIALGKPDKEQIAIEDPAEYAALALKSVLQSEGIAVSGQARADHTQTAPGLSFASVAQPLPKLRTAPGQIETNIDYLGFAVRRSSGPLAEDVAVTLKVSQNLHAELMLRRLGAAYGGEGSAAGGARVVRQFLLNAGLDGDDFVLYDGSGLSGRDLVTPRATAKLLGYAATQPWFAAWRAGLPVGGEDGSLASRFARAPLKDHVFAKTGTLGESRALSGYVDAASGKTLIFSVMVDTHTPATTADRVAMDAIVEAIAAAN